MENKLYKYLLLSLFIFTVLYLGSFNLSIEGFSGNNYPSSIETSLLSDSFTPTGNKNVTDNNASDIWWHYPIFTYNPPSKHPYAQLTNNLRYRRNPDDGECSRSEFCGALYKDNHNKSNVVVPLPPVPDDEGIRVNYYRTSSNLFLSEQPGKLLELPAF
jgi:hypothetical protein